MGYVSYTRIVWQPQTNTRLVWHSCRAQFAGERIPSLEEALSLCEELDLLVYLEVKIDPTRAVQAITKCLSESPSLYQRVAAISFFPNIIYKVSHKYFHNAVISGELALIINIMHNSSL